MIVAPALALTYATQHPKHCGMLGAAGQGDDMKPGSVSRADVAAVMVAALTTDAADKITFELSSDKSEKPTGPPTDIFTGLKQGVFE